MADDRLYNTTEDRPILNKKAQVIFRKNFNAAQLYNAVTKPNDTHVYMVSLKKNATRGIQTSNISFASNSEERLVYFDEVGKKVNCTCLAYGKHGMACKHIYAVIQNLGRVEIFNNAAMTDLLFHPCYLRANMKVAYETKVNIAFGSSLMQIETLGPVVTDKSSCGRRITSKQNLHQSKKTGVKAARCSKCKQIGHNKRKCPLKDVSDENIAQAKRDILNSSNTSRPSRMLTKYTKVTLSRTKKSKFEMVEPVHFLGTVPIVPSAQTYDDHGDEEQNGGSKVDGELVEVLDEEEEEEYEETEEQEDESVQEQQDDAMEEENSIYHSQEYYTMVRNSLQRVLKSLFPE
jgi:hypothetical protein